MSQQHSADHSLSGLALSPAPRGRGPLPTHYGLGVLLELGLIIRPVGLLQQVRQEPLESKGLFRAPDSASPSAPVLRAIHIAASRKPSNPLLFVE